jgi:hypothetical protein
MADYALEARRCWRPLLAALLTVVAATACAQRESGGDSGDRSLMSTENSGFRWVGEGDPSNFASASGFCRRTVQAESFTTLPTQNQRSASTMVGDTPNVAITGVGQRDGFIARRSFVSCMRSQGWAETGEAPEPITVIK